MDYAFDAIGGANIPLCTGATKRGGMVVGYGFMGAPNTLAIMAMFWNILIGAPLRGRCGTFYGITRLYRQDPRPLHEDLPKIFALLAAAKIDPLITLTLPLLAAAKALTLLAAGKVEGKIVLVNP